MEKTYTGSHNVNGVILLNLGGEYLNSLCTCMSFVLFISLTPYCYLGSVYVTPKSTPSPCYPDRGTP